MKIMRYLYAPMLFGDFVNTRNIRIEFKVIDSIAETVATIRRESLIFMLMVEEVCGMKASEKLVS